MMMNSPGSSLPPPLPSDAALTYALTFLGVAADPNGTRERMDQLVAQLEAVHTAVAEHEVAAQKAAEVAARETAVATREQDVSAREEGLLKANTQLQVASNALVSRDEAVKLRESASDRRAAEIEARAKALDDRLEAYRKALA